MKEEDMSNMIKNFSNIMNNGTIPDNVKQAIENISKKQQETDIDTSSSTHSETENAESSNSTGFNITPEMLQNISQMFSNSNSSNNTSTTDSDTNPNTPGIDMATLLKMKTIMDKMNTNKKDPRSQLLLSLKPYLKETRKNKVDQYIQLFNMSKVLEVFNPGGEKSK